MKFLRIAICLLFSLFFFVVSVAATDVGYIVGDVMEPGWYRISDSIDFSRCPSSVVFRLPFDVVDRSFDFFEIQLDRDRLSGLVYVSGNTSSDRLTMYSDGWVDEAYRYVYIREQRVFESDFRYFFHDNFFFLGSSFFNKFSSDFFPLNSIDISEIDVSFSGTFRYQDPYLMWIDASSVRFMLTDGVVSAVYYDDLLVYNGESWVSDVYRSVNFDLRSVSFGNSSESEFDALYVWMMSNMQSFDPDVDVSPGVRFFKNLSSVLDTSLVWLVSAFGRFVGIFWNSTDGLTFLGVLAVAALAIGIAFLIMGVIQRFLHFRG